jgi:hypothetical protein
MKRSPTVRRRVGVAVLAATALALTTARGSTDVSNPEPREMTITGRLVAPDRKGLADGQVALIVQRHRRSGKPQGTFFGWGLALAAEPIACGKTDPDGRFRLTGPAYDPAAPYAACALVAVAPGHALTLKTLDVAAERQEVDLELPSERIIRGRLIDLQGQPAPDAKVHLVWPDPRFGSLWFGKPLEDLLPFWPRPATTDDKGRFLVRGLGNPQVSLEVRHPRLAPQRFQADPVDAADQKEFTFSAVGARRVQVQVVGDDTREAVPDARVIAIASSEEHGMGYLAVEGCTDGDGRLTLNVFPGDYVRVIVHPPPGTAYRTLRQVVPWGRAAGQPTRLALPRGVLVRGRVTEAGTGRSVAGARVQFRARQNNNPFYRQDFQAGSQEENLETAISGSDGRFELAALPGPGHLLVLGPTLDYVHVATTWGDLEYGRPGGNRYYPDGLHALDRKPEAEGPEVAIELRRGETRRARVVGPDGRPVGQFLVFSRSFLPLGYEWWQREPNALEGRDGRFELSGCDPETTSTVWILDRSCHAGATAELSAVAARDPATIRLRPCGSAIARFLDPEGRPAAGVFNGRPTAGFHPFFHMVVTPGAAMATLIFTGQDDGKAVEADWFTWAFRPDGAPDGEADAQGRSTFASLIPGATYRLVLPVRPKSQQEMAERGLPTKDFTVKPGEVLDLGNFTVESD